jgi:2-oxoglutarate dehydrogenase E1 component
MATEGASPDPVPGVGHLARVPLFRDVASDDLKEVAALATEQRFGKDDVICRRGEEGRDLYVITEGSVVVRLGERILATLQAGQVVGELAVLDSRPRSADVIAASDVGVLRIGGEDFQRLLSRSSGLARGLLRVLAGRVRDSSARQLRVDQLVRAYRERGHVLARLDPLGFREPVAHPELDPGHYGLSGEDLDERFSVQLGAAAVALPLREILAHLRETYCGFTGVQYMHVDDLRRQAWLRERLEDRAHRRELRPDEQRRLLSKLTDAEVLETFLHQKFVGAKRFSLEGAETLIPLLDTAVNEAARHGVRHVVIGMAHRGRLNVLANILGKPASRIFREFQDRAEDVGASGDDVKYHLGFESSRVTPSGESIDVSLTVNPSHLEFVGTVVLGRARALQEERRDETGAQVLPIVVHGDAAFAGQGVVQELFNLSALPGYSTGGALHVIVNNQIGFTTPPEESRSCQYATDVARMLQIPVFHVNGERPEAVHRVLQLALEFRATFRSDVVVDMYCYRRHGHNENDETAFTQPLVAACIAEREPMRLTFARNVVALGAITDAEAEDIARSSRARLDEQLEESRRVEDPTAAGSRSTGRWSGFRGGPTSGVPEVDTAVPEERLAALLRKSVDLPSGFAAHRVIERLCKGRLDMALGERPVDWSAAEALAFATLVTEGHPVRLSGQDSQRGTFGHRHAVLHDQASGATCCPLARLAPDQAPFRVFNSPLSETAVLGFDWGYSLERGEGLTIWEAQFGDFANVAQVIVDQFISSAEQKWGLLSGLCLFLPHGFDGQGPEHSSARLERFLSLAARDNMQIVNLSTAGQLFHCLRRQVKRPWRKPLVMMSPKGLLKHPSAASPLAELATGRFRGVLPDPERPLPQASRVLLCSGKIAHDLARERNRREGERACVVRIEQLHPLPQAELRALASQAPAGCPFAWVQEEPENMGAWPYLRSLMPALLPAGAALHLVARPESASPATGSKARHEMEQAALMSRAFDPIGSS